VGFLQLPGAFHGTERHLDTLLRLPNHPTTNDVGDILEQYKDYLNFVVEAGRATNPGVAKKLEEKYAALEKADRTLAARFLRGLRFEILQKVELTGMAPGSVTTALPGVRRWVDRFLAVWLREADEYLFRAKAGRIARAKED
jgi:phytoene dehydrogenase-like protein